MSRKTKKKNDFQAKMLENRSIGWGSWIRTNEVTESEANGKAQEMQENKGKAAKTFPAFPTETRRRNGGKLLSMSKAVAVAGAPVGQKAAIVAFRAKIARCQLVGRNARKL